MRKSILKCVVKLTGVVNANFKTFTAIFRIMSRSKDIDMTLNFICILK